jgi:hypothetical protein
MRIKLSACANAQTVAGNLYILCIVALVFDRSVPDSATWRLRRPRPYRASEFNRINFHTGDFIMKTRFTSSIRLPLMAGALALVIAGCGTTGRFADRSVEPAGYAGQISSTSIPPSIDPFSSSYIPFPVSGNESAGISGHSVFCVQHANQPGCQTFDSARDGSARNDRFSRSHRGNLRDSTTMNTETDSTRGITGQSGY